MAHTVGVKGSCHGIDRIAVATQGPPAATAGAVGAGRARRAAPRQTPPVLSIRRLPRADHGHGVGCRLAASAASTLALHGHDGDRYGGLWLEVPPSQTADREFEARSGRRADGSGVARSAARAWC